MATKKTAKAMSKVKFKAKSKPSRMPKFFVIDDEMKELSAMLEKEISAWAGVTDKPMFGYRGFYRDGVVFAALPRTKAMKSPRSLMIKFAAMSPDVVEVMKKDMRLGTVSEMRSAGWVTFELRKPPAMRDALGWLARAYKAAER